LVSRIYQKDYGITDDEIKHFTLFLELRSTEYPKRLKIEIRRELKACDYQSKIAFSRYSTKQVLVKAHTLEQTMKNKIKAFLDRGEIRDCYDIEFLIRRGVNLPVDSDREVANLRKKMAGFKDIDFRVKLGSILEEDFRSYYNENKFSFLEEKLMAMIPK
jgi:hypothetical protein